MVTIDRKPALVVIDEQNAILGFLDEASRSEVLANTSELAHAFHAAGHPVVWVYAHGLPSGRTQAGLPTEDFPSPEGDLHPELPVTESDIAIHKHGMNAFHGTDLDEQLQSRGITQVVFAGVATGMGVETAARHAFDLGYNVVVAPDATADGIAARKDASIAYVFPGIGEVASTAEITAELR